MKHAAVLLILLSASVAALAQPAAAERETDRPATLPSASPQNSQSGQPAAPQPAVADTVPATNAPDSSSIGEYVLDDKHQLLPGDRIGFQIVEDRTNAISMFVAESRELDIPYIGRVSVAGKTCKQAAEDIKALLEKDYYYKATVIIGLDALSKVLGKVYVFGPVRNPGPVEIPSNETFTAGKAILRAGGFGDFANKKKVQIVRKTETGNRTILVNMDNVLVKGKTEEDVTLEPDDFIIVPQRSVNW